MHARKTREYVYVGCKSLPAFKKGTLTVPFNIYDSLFYFSAAFA